ncbi:DUF1223 domain-containing protein [Desertibaculum subflavum]|uniref:DUF1223 domain-containing protein n=1 Tax=Desertibaculum subflavum TaxID=2268458 RepID=UPI000E663FF7
MTFLAPDALGRCLLGLALTLFAALPAAAGERAPVVVELFTSQGCNSCPPADKFLGELAQRNDVLALSFHVDYWDYLGWKDTFGSKENTHRQSLYRDRLMGRYVYTPQMIIDGRVEMQGTDRSRAATEIVKSKTLAELGDNAALAPIDCSETKDGKYMVSLPARPGIGAVPLWLVRFDPRHEVAIGRGENSGRKLVYTNVVREIRRIGEWKGEAMQLTLPADAVPQGSGAAILAQDGHAGRILAAGRF